MIDTFNIRLHKPAAGRDPLQVERYIEPEKTGKYATSGEPFIVGHIGCYRVYSDPAQVRLSGSVANLLHGENISDPTRKEVAEGVQWLSDALHIDIGRGDVCRCDVAHTFDLPATPAQYIGQLVSRGDAPRIEYEKNTLYFAQSGRWLCFYDKRLEMATRGEIIPLPWADCQNLLRYEMRIVGSVRAQVGAVTASEITKPKTWARLVNLWAQEYQAIRKASAERIRASSTPKMAFDAIFADLLHNVPADYLANTLKMITKEGVLNKSERYRLKQMIKQAISGCNYSVISKLDAAVEQVRAEAVSV